jgi:hypothetical protein
MSLKSLTLATDYPEAIFLPQIQATTGLFAAFFAVGMTDSADKKTMGTTLELAREIRDRIVNHSTGRLNITFADGIRAVDFSEGTIVTRREQLFSCLDEPPVGFDFLPMDIAGGQRTAEWCDASC